MFKKTHERTFSYDGKHHDPLELICIIKSRCGLQCGVFHQPDGVLTIVPMDNVQEVKSPIDSPDELLRRLAYKEPGDLLTIEDFRNIARNIIEGAEA